MQSKPAPDEAKLDDPPVKGTSEEYSEAAAKSASAQFGRAGRARIAASIAHRREQYPSMKDLDEAIPKKANKRVKPVLTSQATKPPPKDEQKPAFKVSAVSRSFQLNSILTLDQRRKARRPISELDLRKRPWG